MVRAAIHLLWLAAALAAQTGQQGPAPEWPCVAGRAADPSYLEIAESSGGHVFLFQKGEVEHAGLVMSASHTHPDTIVRAVGHLSGTREFEFPVDSRVESLLVLASLQCPSAIGLFRPAGVEMTAVNSTGNVALKAGRIVRVDAPESGKWKVRLNGTGLFVLCVLAKSDLRLTSVVVPPGGRAGASQEIHARMAGKVSAVKFELTGAEGALIAVGETSAAEDGAYRFTVTPPAERFRLVVSGIDEGGAPFRRTHPVLFREPRE